MMMMIFIIIIIIIMIIIIDIVTVWCFVKKKSVAFEQSSQVVIMEHIVKETRSTKETRGIDTCFIFKKLFYS